MDLLYPDEAAVPKESKPSLMTDVAVKERYYSLVGWAVAMGMVVVVVMIIGYAAFKLSNDNIVVSAIVMVVVGLGVLLLVRYLLRRCNYSLPCFLTGSIAARKLQPISVMRRQPILNLTPTALTDPPTPSTNDK